MRARWWLRTSDLRFQSGRVDTDQFWLVALPVFLVNVTPLTMAGHGKKFDFHGSFLSKEKAVAKEREVGGFIREKRIDGKIHYFVLTERK